MRKPAVTAAIVATTTAGAMALAWAAPAGAAASAGTASATARPVPAVTGSWRVSKVIRGSGVQEVTAVTAASSRSAWAFQTNSTSAPPAAWHLAGSRWVRTSFPAPRPAQVTAAAESSAANVWAFTTSDSRPAGTALRWNGSRWAVVRRLGSGVSGAVVLSRRDVWAFGADGPLGIFRGPWHYNGHIWKRYRGLGELDGGSALSARSIWGYGGKGVAHWNGRRWRKTSLASLLPHNTAVCVSQLTGIYARSARDVWALGDSGCEDFGGRVILLHYNGSRWQRQPIGTVRGGSGPLIADGRGGLWFTTQTGVPPTAHMLHYARGRVTTAALPRVPRLRLELYSLAAAGASTTAFAGGEAFSTFGPRSEGVVLRFSR